ncbi:MAG: hypothetical protein WA110_07590 [Anaerolineaceae bacterium]
MELGILPPANYLPTDGLMAKRLDHPVAFIVPVAIAMYGTVSDL